MAFNVPIPERPTSTIYYTKTYFKTHLDDDWDDILEMINIMKDKKMTSDTSGYWSLDAFSHHRWRKSQKNQDRDFRKWATGAYYEEMYVDRYRVRMFEFSEAARFLHTSLRACLSAFAKPRGILSNNGTSRIARIYDYPDHARVPICPQRPQFDIGYVIEGNDQLTYINTARKGIQAIMKSISNHYCAKRIPGSKIVHSDVEDVLKNLEWVSILPPLLFRSFRLSFFQVLIKNANVLQRIRV